MDFTGMDEDGLKKLAAAVAEETKRRENAAMTQLFASALQQLQSCFVAPIVYTSAQLSPAEWAVHPTQQESFLKLAKIYASRTPDLDCTTAWEFVRFLRNSYLSGPRESILMTLGTSPTFCSIKAEEGPIKEFLRLLTWPDAQARPPFSPNAILTGFGDPTRLDQIYAVRAKSSMEQISTPDALTLLYLDVLSRRFSPKTSSP